MRALVVMAVLGASVAFPFVQDASGLAALQAYAQPDPAVQPKWYGPLASLVPAGVPGSSAYVADTADVNGARNAFFNTYKAQLAATRPKDPSTYNQYYNPYSPSYSSYEPQQPKWTGPLASKVPAGLPGSSPIVADTPSVRAAKASFYNSYTRALKATLPSPY